MSKPENPLNLFRSYSYHHILVACDSTACAEELANPEIELSAFDHPLHGRFTPQVNSKGRYIVLVNGLSDTQFSIYSAKWSNVIIPSRDGVVGGESQLTTMAVDGEIIIQEPQGINFLNLLNETTKQLGRDPTSVVFVLKTIFVGIRDDGHQELISNVRPLLFLLVDIGAIFDVTGAEYTIALVGIVNGAGRLPHASSIGNEFKYTIKSGEIKLGELIEDLQVEINRYYKARKQALIEQSQKCGVSDVDWDSFIDVEYRFEIDEGYKNYIVGTNLPAIAQDTGNNDGILETKGDSMSIETLLGMIMKSSKDVMLEDQREHPDHPGKRFQYKITSSITSTDTKYIVNYQIQRYEAYTVKPEMFQTWEPPKNDDGETQGLELDYIFTGQNVDVITFDIKMQYGLMFFQTLGTTQSVPGSTQKFLSFYNADHFTRGIGNAHGSGDQTNEVPNTQPGAGGYIKKKTPLFLGTTLKDPMFRNARFEGPTESYKSRLERHAAFENLEARVVIRGNPQLLEESTQLPKDLTLSNSTQTSQVITTSNTIRLEEDFQPRRIMPKLHKIPGFVKVNVFMPTEWNASNNDDTTKDYAQNFWYKGWYFLYAINNVFDNGEFTQELEMLSMPVDTYDNMEQCEEQQTRKTVSSESGTGKKVNNDDVMSSTVKDMEQERSNAAKRKPPRQTR